jgi:hypothetical protein
MEQTNTTVSQPGSQVTAQAAPTVPEKKKSNGLKSIISMWRLVVIVVLGFLLVYFVWGLYEGLKSSVTLESRGTPAACTHDFCISYNATYKQQASTWEVQPGWPLKFAIYGPTFARDDTAVTIRCPLSNKGENDLVTKFMHLLTQERVQECVVVGR